jgi:predicted dehydrogenase
MAPLRFGLVGTGYWARTTHAPALASTEGIEFAAIWGRSPEAAGKLAAAHQVRPYEDLDAFLADVDAVAFAVPPDVQAPIATRAASLGKHLLLEKPIATTGEDADALTAAVDRAKVASLVFFTARFQPEIRDWLAGAGKQRGWKGGAAIWLGTALHESSPYNTPWRHEKGGLWDIGPHVVALLWACLGPVHSVTADAGAADITHLVLHHENGATSTITATLSAPPPAAVAELFLWGEHGRSAAPMKTVNALPALRIALAELAANAASGQLSHPCDVHLGQAVGRILAAAQRQIKAKSHLS